MKLFIVLYDNEYASIIDIYFYESFLWNSKLKRLRFISLDTLSDILDKCLRFSLKKTDSILIKEKCKHLSKTSDRVSKEMKRKRLSLEFQRKDS
jgi:hypothetical protein